MPSPWRMAKARARHLAAGPLRLVEGLRLRGRLGVQSPLELVGRGISAPQGYPGESKKPLLRSEIHTRCLYNSAVIWQ